MGKLKTQKEVNKPKSIEEFFENIDDDTLIYLTITGDLKLICAAASLDYQSSSSSQHKLN